MKSAGMLPWDLEDWLTEEGDRIVRAEADGRPLSEIDRLIHEIWLLDTESRNGGLSQYFANWGVEQWRACVLAASRGLTPSFPAFAAEVDATIGDSLDPYESISSLGSPAEGIWDKYKIRVVAELKAAHEREQA